MAKSGEENKVSILLRPNQQQVDTNYIFESLFWKEHSNNQINYAEKAQQIFNRAAKRGDNRLGIDNYEKVIEELGLTKHQYYLILRRLREAGLIYKSQGKFYISTIYKTHIQRMAATINNMLLDKGVE